MSKRFEASLPPEYLSFLSVWNGGGEHAAIFGTRSYRVESSSGSAQVDGFIQQNERLRGHGKTFEDVLAYGSVGSDYIVQNVKTGAWSVRSFNGTEYEKFSDFAAVAKFAMT